METEGTPAASAVVSPRKVRYSGVVLEPHSRQVLIAALRDRLRPLLEAGWQTMNKPPAGMEPELLPHHMTIVPFQELPENLKSLLGTTQTMVAIRWGQDERAAAVEVRTTIPTQNARPHITVAVSPTGKPFHSNEIPAQNWVDLPVEIPVQGIVQEV